MPPPSPSSAVFVTMTITITSIIFMKSIMISPIKIGTTKNENNPENISDRVSIYDRDNCFLKVANRGIVIEIAPISQKRLIFDNLKIFGAEIQTLQL